MRSLPLFLTAALLLAMTLATPADARSHDARIWVSFGDVVFSAGTPYHRIHHHPLQVVHDRHGPRYFYYAPPPRPVHYHAPVYVPAPVYRHHVYRAPPPPRQPRPGYYSRRPGY